MAFPVVSNHLKGIPPKGKMDRTAAAGRHAHTVVACDPGMWRCDLILETTFFIPVFFFLYPDFHET